MKRLLIILSFVTSTIAVKAQFGCFSPSLGVYDANTNASLSATLPCTYSNVISIQPTQVFSGNNATSPCLMLEIGTTNANSTTNNTLTMYQGTTQVVSLCSSTPAPCWTVVPNNSSYSLSVAFLNPAASHSYSLCNIATATSFTYKVKSCYANTVIASGTWTNNTANFCQSVFIPSNTAIGIASYTISPGVPSTASLSNPTGYLLLDTDQITAGIYTITYGFDSQSGCTTTATQTISITNPFSAAWTNIVPQCTNNACTSLTTQITGTSGGSFSGTGVTTNSFCPATAGVGNHVVTYSVGVSTACGAAFTNTVIVAPQPVSSAGATKSITCANNPTVLTGGGGGTYSWSHNGALGNNFSTTQNPTVGLTGTYSLVVNNGTCVSSAATVAVVNNFAQPNIPSTSVSSTVNCINITVTITTSGNTAGATYTWSGPGIVGSPNQSSVVVNQGGNYTYTITHPATGCTSNSVVAVTQNTSVPLTITNGAAINCTNNTTSLIGNQSSYNYTWTAPATGAINSGQSTPTIIITGTGVYTATVMNPLNGCIASFTRIPTTNTTVITPTISNSPIITCTNPTATLNGLPGSGVTYTWSGTSIVGSPNTQNANINAGGGYTLAVTNTTNGCIGTRTITIATNTTPPTSPTITPNNVTLACPAQTAIITGTATGATSYTWLPPAGGSILSGGNTATAQVTSSSPGIFTLVTTAANGCQSSQVATVSPNTNAPTFTLSNPNPSITCASTTPSTTVNITSTVTIASYSWGPSGGISGPTNTTSVTFTTAGSYTVAITATNGCISTGVVVVSTATTPPSVVAGTGTAQVLSCTNSISIINPSYTPTSPNYTYTWSGPGIVGSANNSSVQVNQAGTYTLAITDTVTGCSSGSFTVDVTGNNVPPTLNVSSNSTIGIGCSASTSTAQLTASSSSSVTYLWSNAATTSVITVNTAGIYTVTITDPITGCKNSNTVEVINSSAAPGFSATSVGNFPCGTTGSTLQLLAATSSSNAIGYSWFGTSIVSGSNTANPIIDQPGIYTVVATDLVTGCISTSTLALFQPTVVANFTVNAIVGQAPLNVNFTNLSLGAGSYNWTFTPTGVSTSTDPTFNFTLPGTYTVVLVSTNGICSDTHTLIIIVEGGLGTVPGIFTPNGDGKNDPFFIPGLDSYPKNKLQIFNRWGNMVYEAAPYNNDWDGTPNKSSMGTGKLPVGAYFYILDLGDEREPEPKKGFVQLEY